MSASGGWLDDTSGTTRAGCAVVVKNASDIVGLYVAENNGVNEGYSGTGYYKVSVDPAPHVGTRLRLGIWPVQARQLEQSTRCRLAVVPTMLQHGVDYRAGRVYHPHRHHPERSHRQQHFLACTDCFWRAWLGAAALLLRRRATRTASRLTFQVAWPVVECWRVDHRVMIDAPFSFIGLTL